MTDRPDVVTRTAQEQLVVTAAHELHGPIAALVAGLDTLERVRGLPDGDQEQILAALNRQARHLSALVTDVLAVANGGPAPSPVLVPVPLPDVLATAVDATAVPEGKRLIVSVQETVIAEPVGLTRVVTNLLCNAFRYGGPCVEVSSAVTDSTISLTIADDGPGVPKPFEATMFDRFTRGGNTNGYGGLGIGLRVSRDLIESFGGTLTYESAVPTGSRFTIQLAIAAAA
jgi:signal transduction histidine kinase